jgi:integral membrane protein (TIGR01906 family)
MGSRPGGWLVAAAAAVVILGASIAPFLAPPIVRFEQDRIGVGAATGDTPATIDQITSRLLADLVLWQGDFDVLSADEQAHMRDVRNVFTGFWILVLCGIGVLAVAFRRSSTSLDARAATWRALGGGARILAVVIAVLGVVVVVAFDAAFEVFHRLFFSAGSYTFDPATSTLVQLFPERFWSETSIAVGIVTIVAAILMAWFARRRAASASKWREKPVFTATRAGT